MAVVAICTVIRAVPSIYKMLGKHLMKVVVAVLLQMGKLRDGEVKWVTGGHFLVQWQNQTPVMILSFILHLLWTWSAAHWGQFCQPMLNCTCWSHSPESFQLFLPEILLVLFSAAVLSLLLYILHYEACRAENVFVYSYEMSHLGKIRVIPVFIPFPQTRINPVLFRKPESAQAFPLCHSVPESLLW